jgi:CBS domain-containing membrane protein
MNKKVGELSKIFTPLLPGANGRDRAMACLGAVLAITLTGALTSFAFRGDPHVPLLAAPMGASAVLLFAVPASPLAQPWPIIGGNFISAIIGILVSRFVPDAMIASGLAVALAIAVMSVLRCLHPPGGAAALSAVLAGPTIAANGFMYPLVPLGVNALVLVAMGWLFHSFTRHPWPHLARLPPTNVHKTHDAPPALRAGFNSEDVDAALADLGEAFDIERDDIERLLERVALRAMARHASNPLCADIMSRDLVTIGPDSMVETARALLIEHNVRTLPVLDQAGQLLGSIGLRDLSGSGQQVRDKMRPAATALPTTPVIDILGPLTDGLSHAVIITSDTGRALGLITQTDLLSTLTRDLRKAA